jgi:DNA polymerase-1
VKIAAFDTETAGLGGTVHRLGVLTSDGLWYWYSLEDARRNSDWREELYTSDAIVAHNIKYDAKVMGRDLNFSLPWGHAHDTMVMAALRRPAHTPKDLLSLSMEEFDYDGAEDLVVDEYNDSHDLEGDYSKIPDSVLEPYTRRQLLNTLLLFKKFRSSMPEGCYDIERLVIKYLTKMEERGVLIERSILESAHEKLDMEIAKIKNDIFTNADTWDVSLPIELSGLFGVDFNLNSTDQLSKVLIARGFDLPETASSSPAKRRYSTAEKTLKKIAGDDPFVGRLLDLRESEKLQGTYVEGLLTAADANGIISPNFSTTVTSTGRLSCSSPNLQNVAGRSESAKIVREAFVARKGFTNVSFDYSQIEFRLAIFLSQDTNGIHEFENNIDFHTAAAAAIFGKHPEEVTKKERSTGKTINFAIIYGAGPAKIASNLGVTERRAWDILESYSSHYGTLWRFKDKLEKFARRNGYIELPFGRHLYIDDNHSYKAFNYLIQGGAADVIKKAMVDVGEALEHHYSNMLLQIHDELVVEIHKTERDMIPEVARLMTETTGLCPLDVDVEEWDGNWANIKPLAPF